MQDSTASTLTGSDLPTSEQLAQLQETLAIEQTKHQIEQMRRDTHSLQAEANWLHLASQVADMPQSDYLQEGFGNYIDPATPYTEDPSFYPGGYGGVPAGHLLSRPPSVDDFQDGDYRPFWNGFAQYQLMQGITREIAMTNSIAIALVEGLCDYAIHKGFSYACKPIDPKDTSESTTALADDCDKIFREFDRNNSWSMNYQAYFFEQSRYKGEAYVEVQDAGDGRARIREMNPINIVEPQQHYTGTLEDFYGLPASSWTYGVVTPLGNTSDVLGYFHDTDHTGHNHEFIKAEHVAAVRLNAPTMVKRGLTDFYPALQIVKALPQLLYNLVIGAGIQASIALIEKRLKGASGVGADITPLGKPGQSRGQGSNIHQEFYRPGMIAKASGVDIMAGPMGSSASGPLMNIFETTYRLVGMRYKTPEYMSSGRDQNTSRANGDNSQQPFIKATERRQLPYVAAYTKVYMRVLEIAIKAGRLRHHGIQTMEDLTAICEPVVTPTDIGGRDKTQELAHRKALTDAKIMSRRTWSDKEGLEWDVERQRVEEEATDPIFDTPPPFGSQGFGQSGFGGSFGSSPGGQHQPQQSQPKQAEPTPANLPESTQRLNEAAAMLWDDYPIDGAGKRLLEDSASGVTDA